MRLLRSVLLGGVALLSGCGALELERAKWELEQAKVLWSQQALENYDFLYSRSCFCTLADQALSVSVRSGTVFEVKYRDTGEVLPSDEAATVPNIGEMFAKLDRASRTADVWSGFYDPHQGYPLVLFIDWDRQAVDDEINEGASSVIPR